MFEFELVASVSAFRHSYTTVAITADMVGIIGLVLCLSIRDSHIVCGCSVIAASRVAYLAVRLRVCSIHKLEHCVSICRTFVSFDCTSVLACGIMTETVVTVVVLSKDMVAGSPISRCTPSLLMGEARTCRTR